MLFMFTHKTKGHPKQKPRATPPPKKNKKTQKSRESPGTLQLLGSLMLVYIIYLFIYLFTYLLILLIFVFVLIYLHNLLVYCGEPEPRETQQKPGPGHPRRWSRPRWSRNPPTLLVEFRALESGLPLSSWIRESLASAGASCAGGGGGIGRPVGLCCGSA